MNRQDAVRLISETFHNAFDENRFRLFTRNLFNDLDESKAFDYYGQFIPDAYKDHVKRYKRVGKYTDPEGAALDVLIVNLKKEAALDRTRTMQRNFIAWYLKNRGEKDAALVAYHSDGLDDWRFSFVRMDYRTVEEGTKVKIREELTPARRYSFLVGKNEPNHTAEQQLLPILQDDRSNPILSELEKAFNIESVTKEFFEKYKNLFLKLKEEIDTLVASNSKVKRDFASTKIETADFAKKLLGQIVFLYFLQKKGWLGVEKDEAGNFKGWGTGPKDFLRRLFEKMIVPYDNFFNDLLEPLFYEALAIDRGVKSFYSPFKCKIPFLNGGLFEPIGGYNWQETDILLKNETFAEIFDTFDLYNFTVREDEPLEKEVAVDPEMLGKVFENLLEIKDRKSKGAFYTPREIVHYMCRESLINYLDTAVNTSGKSLVPQKTIQNKLFGKPDPERIKAETYHLIVPQEDIEIFIRHGEYGIENDIAKERGTKSYSYKLPESIRTNARLLDSVLANIKICDPAIGSGAFPVGMLHEIVSAREILTAYIGESPERTRYNFKRHAIQESIYGVDIDGSAVDIAKLRLWLSLVVDEDDFETIKPLPNLDYKIVTGNSLLGVKKDLLNDHLFKELEGLKQQFFDETNPRKKKEEKGKIDQLIRLITNNDEHFDFEIYFSEIFHQKGFDVVIGNPPYLGFHGIEKVYKKKLQNHFDSAKGKFDLYVLFIEKGFYLLKNNGFFIFICPTAFTKREHGIEIRKFLLKHTSLVELVDFEHTQIFDKATNYTGIFSYKKSYNSKNQFKYKNGLDDQNKMIEQSNLMETPWILTDNIYNGIITKINNFTKLHEITKISEGVVTGLNTLYLLTKKEIEQNNYETKYFVPCYRGKDVDKYYLKENTEYLFYPYQLINNKTVPIDEETLTANCPRYLKYLKDNIELINKRAYFAKSNKKWYELWNQRHLSNFINLKIITPELSDRNRFSIADSCTFYGDTVCGITIRKEFESLLSIKYLIAILNSSLMEWGYKQITVPKAGGFFIYKVMFLKNIPIKIVPFDDQRSFMSIVDQIHALKQKDSKADISGLERKIDNMVYALYGITRDEILIIEHDINRRLEHDI